MARSLRIALLLDPFTLRRKGGEHSPLIASELLSRGHEVRVFGDARGDVPHSSAGPESEGGTSGPEGLGVLSFAPDVVVAYDVLSPAAWHGARCARRLGVPLVLIEEGYPDRTKAIVRIKRWVGERMFRPRVRRTAHRIVALDPVARAQVLAAGFHESRIDVLPSGVDLSTFRPGLASELPQRHGVRGRFLLHVGRLENARGLEVLVSSFAATVGRREDWSLVFAGTGAARPRLRVHAELLGIGARVHWLGVPRPEELPGLFGSATALVVPVLDDDVASLKIRRAFACGLPVIASEVPRLADLVEHDVTGLLATAGDVAAWTDALRTLASDPARRSRWGTNARETAEQRFAWTAIADRFESLLLQAVDSRVERRVERPSDATVSDPA